MIHPTNAPASVSGADKMRGDRASARTTVDRIGTDRTAIDRTAMNRLGIDRRAIATPLGQGGLVAKIAGGRLIPGWAARIGAWIAAGRSGPFRWGSTVIAARHADIADILARDVDFRIAPVNEARIAVVNGPFVLGMDRSALLERERHALYMALAAVDLDAIVAAGARDADLLLDAADGTIDAVGGYARHIAGRTAVRLFGIAGDDEPLFLDVVRSIFAHTFLNLGGDRAIEARAIAASELMRGWFGQEIARRRADGAPGDDMMGQLLRQGLLDDNGVRRTLGGMLVGSIDTTASSVARVLIVMARDRRLRADAERRPRETGGDWHRRLNGLYQDALRRWPHNPLVLRRAAADTMVGTTRVAKGDRLLMWTQAAMQDPAAFPRPGQMRADRSAAAYLHFGAGLHPCAGRAVNARQIPMLIGKLIDRRFRIAGRLGWAGPFPHQLPVTLEVRSV
jgi:cytochrome P450